MRGAAVSVFHGSEWCGPGSLEFLAGRSEALIYQDVLAVRCVRGKGNSDSSTRTPAHTQLSEAPLHKCEPEKSLSLIQEVSETGFSGISVVAIWKAFGKICDYMWTPQMRCAPGRCICSHCLCYGLVIIMANHNSFSSY